MPADNIKDVFNNANPDAPLESGDRRYYDCSAYRGEDNIIKRMLNAIKLSDTTTCQLLAGPRGSGKTTELKRLQKNLEDEKYWVVYCDVTTGLDLEDTETIDIVLALIKIVVEELNERGIKISSALVKQFLSNFKETVFEKEEYDKYEAEVKSEAKTGFEIPLFGSLMTKITGMIKAGTTSKKTVREKLDPQFSKILDDANNIILAAIVEIKKKKYTDLVLIVDNLEKIVIKDKGDQRTSHSVIFIEQGDRLKNLNCHLVYTIPINLVYSPKNSDLREIFGCEPKILPMVKVQDPHNNYRTFDKGINALKDLLAQRIAIEKAFAEGVAEYLCRMSGGHIRELMIMIREACTYLDDLPITMEVAEKVVNKQRENSRRAISKDYWVKLAEVDKTKEVDDNGLEYQNMLYYHMVLLYMNDENWYDVHPIIKELERFKQAAKALKK